MALTVSNVKRDLTRVNKVVIADVTFDASYPTGGLALTPGQLGLKEITTVNDDGVGGRTFPYNRSTGKLMAFASTTEVANATNLSAVTTRLTVIGR